MTTEDLSRGTARFIGRVRGDAPGPTLLVVAAIHGNEPAGVDAARRVLERLRTAHTRLRGEFAAVVGNAEALARGVRYVDHDLNRSFTPERVGAARSGSLASGGRSEDREHEDLQAAVDEVIAAARGDVHFVDLHSTSGEGAPFLVVADNPASRAFAEHFPLTRLVSLVEKLSGTLVGAVGAEVTASIVLESGQHSHPAAAQRAEALLWIALVRAGLLDESDAPPLAPLEELLGASRGDLPGALEVAYRHAIRPADGFRMRPGYRHFQRVAQGETVADDARGPVRAPFDGYMLMPLYQGLGDDGFFLAR
jgi:predicted deacylase